MFKGSGCSTLAFTVASGCGHISLQGLDRLSFGRLAVRRVNKLNIDRSTSRMINNSTINNSSDSHSSCRTNKNTNYEYE